MSIPNGITGVLANVTIVGDGPSGGYVSAFPGDLPPAPNTSTVNPSTAIAASFRGHGLPGAAAGARAGSEGSDSTNAQHVLTDVVGYFGTS